MGVDVMQPDGTAVTSGTPADEVHPDGSGRGERPDGPSRRSQVVRKIRARKVPILLTVVTLVTGMAFMFFWYPVVYHHDGWAIGGDVWGIWRAAHYVGWGDLGGVYTPGTGVVSLPGMPVLLAPLAMLSGRLGLSESALPILLIHPTAALILQPAEILLSSSVLFASDALAERFGVPARRRVGLCVVVALVAWPVGVLWGHAEDTLALTLAVYALLAGLDRRWAACGWLFGCALAVQPLVALLIPLVIAMTPAGQRFRTLARSLLLPGFLLIVAFAGDAADAWRAVVQEPTPPSVNHATPWAALAPVVEVIRVHATQVSHAVLAGSGVFGVLVTKAHAGTETAVSGGPGRFLYFALAIGAGLFLWRRPQPAIRLFWIAAMVLGARCFFEAVMTPYYLAPPFILALAVASRSGGRRFWTAVVVAVATSVFAYFRLGPWEWWLPVVTGAAVVVAMAYPSDAVVEAVQKAVNRSSEPGSEPDGADGSDLGCRPGGPRAHA
jgi:hypothetical protein